MVVLLLLGAVGDRWRAGRVRAVDLPPAPPPAAGSPAPPGPTPARTPGGAAVDLNRASAAELDALPGIGPVLAERIVEHRRLHGPFRDPDELLAVRGIGPRLLERLRPLVRAGGGESPR